MERKKGKKSKKLNLIRTPSEKNPGNYRNRDLSENTSKYIDLDLRESTGFCQIDLSECPSFPFKGFFFISRTIFQNRSTALSLIFSSIPEDFSHRNRCFWAPNFRFFSPVVTKSIPFPLFPPFTPAGPPVITKTRIRSL
jgi:hypothetical protein